MHQSSTLHHTSSPLLSVIADTTHQVPGLPLHEALFQTCDHPFQKPRSPLFLYNKKTIAVLKDRSPFSKIDRNFHRCDRRFQKTKIAVFNKKETAVFKERSPFSKIDRRFEGCDRLFQTPRAQFSKICRRFQRPIAVFKSAIAVLKRHDRRFQRSVAAF